jgi:hypothetical protein
MIDTRCGVAHAETGISSLALTGGRVSGHFDHCIRSTIVTTNNDLNAIQNLFQKFYRTVIYN